MPEPSDLPAPYVFLSYASADRERALRIADLLEGQGVRVWIDRHSIEGGSRALSDGEAASISCNVSESAISGMLVTARINVR